MSSARFVVGDTRKVLAGMPDASVDLVLTSPPFLALRSYLPADHPDKASEMGGEPTPGAFIDGLLDVVEECRRVLAPHGSLCFELGDTYAGSGGAGGDYNANGLRDGQARFDGSASKAYGAGAAPRPPRNRWRSPSADPRYAQRGEQSQGTGAGGDWPLDKSLCLIPELFRISLVYGFNPLTGRETPRWRARNVIRWARPNPPVGALADKVRPATSDMVVACTSRKRWFDLDAVRTDAIDQRHRNTNGTKQRAGDPAEVMTANFAQRVPSNHAGAPPLDHWWHDDVFEQDAWLIPTEPFRGAHYATWPTELCRKPIEMMCPRRVCTVCGEPSRRMVETTRTLDGQAAALPAMGDEHRMGATANGVGHWRLGTAREDLGWSDCGCPGGDRWRAGVVLDPFCGSGTTLAVATGHGRDAIGIDLDARNAHLAQQRVGLFLSVEQPA